MLIPFSTYNGSELKCEMIEAIPDFVYEAIKRQWWSEQITMELHHLGLDWARNRNDLMGKVYDDSMFIYAPEPPLEITQVIDKFQAFSEGFGISTYR